MVLARKIRGDFQGGISTVLKFYWAFFSMQSSSLLGTTAGLLCGLEGPVATTRCQHRGKEAQRVVSHQSPPGPNRLAFQRPPGSGFTALCWAEGSAEDGVWVCQSSCSPAASVIPKGSSENLHGWQDLVYNVFMQEKARKLPLMSRHLNSRFSFLGGHSFFSQCELLTEVPCTLYTAWL